jgi:hypothetical protein
MPEILPKKLGKHGFNVATPDIETTSGVTFGMLPVMALAELPICTFGMFPAMNRRGRSLVMERSKDMQIGNRGGSAKIESGQKQCAERGRVRVDWRRDEIEDNAKGDFWIFRTASFL